MQFEIDPAADAIWGSVGSVTTGSGTVENKPHGQADWENLRRSALILLEATNLLVVPGRSVSRQDFESDGPGVLGSRDIARRLREDPAAFNGLAQALRTTARDVLTDIEEEDASALLRDGERLDAACEACHVANWYPHQIIPALPADPPQPQ